MTDREVKLVVGALLHDIGKVIYRQGDDRRKHSQSGYDFLKNEVNLQDNEVLDCVRFHHADAMKDAKVAQDALAYIVYIADNIASSVDRRQSDSEDSGFEISMPLQTVFNILNGNHQEMCYEPKTLDSRDDINYPTSEKRQFDEHFYATVKDNILNNLHGLDYNQDYINSLLEVLEANLSYVPSSTAKHEVADISLFDHMKITAAVASCILRYLQELGRENYQEVLYQESTKFYEKDAFLLYSMDVSGIQDYIYTVNSKNALKTLRARSFYLEIMMEHMIDSLLEKLHLSRANLIYSGGGHCYILVANTEKTRQILEQYQKDTNDWLMSQYRTALYVAGGYAECSANALKNVPEGSYSDIFRRISNAISSHKNNRYTAQDIIRFNSEKIQDYTRECRVCKRIGKVTDEDICPVCKAIERFSKNILYDDFFTVSLEESEDSLPLPGNYYLHADNRKTLTQKMQEDMSFVRAYSKNELYTGKQIATKLWVGDYTIGKNFKEMASLADGIERIAVIRADVDNLGQAFVAGFENPENHNRYVTLSRTATLSRQLSLFFKLHINRIMNQAEYSMERREKAKRNATICYSGGDDLFIVGAWNDVIELAIDIRRDFARYTQGTLTLSAGIGIYQPDYPIHAIAAEVARMEDTSKNLPGKDAVTLFEDGMRHKLLDTNRWISDGTYRWAELEDEVLGDKFTSIAQFFDASEDKGKNFLYNLLELIRGRDEKINFARYVYLLSRMEPDREASEREKATYREFSSKMYQWIKDEKDCRQLKTAMNIYAYLRRERME